VRRKMLLLLVVAGVAIGLIGVVGSAAWFTDEAAVPMSAAGATLDIQAEAGREGLPAARQIYPPSTVELTLTNLAPGVWSTDTYMINVQNKNTPASTLSVKYRYRVEEKTSSTGFFDGIVVKAETGFCLTDATDFTITFPTTVYEGPLSAMEFTNTDAGKGNLPINNTHCYRFSFKLDDSAGNELQGGTATFDVVIDATQPENPGWTQS
jgi:hypothetical protein